MFASVAVLPAASVTVASTEYSPSANSTGTSTEKVPSACTVVVSVCTLPALSVTVRVIVEPGAASVVPESVGVVSLFVPCASNEITGAVVSISPVLASVAVLPAASVTVASTEYSPSANSSGTSTEKVPSACTVVVSVCTFPALSVTVSVTVEPDVASVLPDKVGVESLLRGIPSSVTVMSAASSPPSPNCSDVISSLSLAPCSNSKATGSTFSLILSTRTKLLPPAPPPPSKPAAVASNDSKISSSPASTSKKSWSRFWLSPV